LNLYFVVEGRRSEPRVYKAWINLVFPELSQVQRLEDINDNSFVMMAGNGYPAYKALIPAALSDIALFPVFDHLFICVDAEDLSAHERRAQVESLVHSKLAETGVLNKCPRLCIHVIVQNCCIETWFLGNPDMVHPEPSPEFATLRAFYHVGLHDPEEMPRNPQKPWTRARFHKHYLDKMLLEHKCSFPGIAKDPAYLQALRLRCTTTSHLPSLRRLLDTWDNLKADKSSAA